MWQDEYYLSSLLNTSFQLIDNKDAIKVIIKRDSNAALSMMTVRNLEKLALELQPKFPMTAIVRNETLAIYQKIFTFLLQTRMASYVLNLSLKAREPESEHAKRLVARFRHLRVRLMHFVNAIKNYVMTTVSYA